MRSLQVTNRDWNVGRLGGTVLFAGLITVLAAGLAAGAGASRARAARSAGPATGTLSAAKAAVSANYGKLALGFEANRGQVADAVDFLTRGRGYTLFLTRDHQAVIARTTLGQNPRPGDVFRLRLLHANPAASVAGAGELPGKTNYFIGNDPREWRTNIPNYSRVEYSDVYPGVNLVYYGSGRQLEYDFRLAPGADPGAIALEAGPDRPTSRSGQAYEAAPRLADSGDLVIPTPAGEIRLHKPVAYQLGAGGARLPVSVKYLLKTGSSQARASEPQIGFALGTYDHRLQLIIDPVLTYSTFLGGMLTDNGYAIAVDSSGNAYVAGSTASTDFPGVSGGACQTCGTNQGGDSDVFVAKLNSSGTALVYSTYIGGAGADQAAGIALDSSGDAFITGQTDSTNFPTTAGAYQTLCGGPAGPACTPKVYDAFVTKLNGDGTALDYSTYLGGGTADQGYGIAVDSSGNVYVSGLTTSSTTFPVTSGAFQGTFGGGSQDAFISKLNPGGNSQADLLYSTFLGGSGADQAEGIALGLSGNVFVAGQTISTNFPVTSGAYDTACGTDGNCNTANSDAFLSKLNLGGNGHADLLYSTYLGGSGGDEAKSVAVDAGGNAYVTGDTLSADFPISTGAFQTVSGGGSDAFVTKLNPAGTGPSDLIYSTYLGGSDVDQGNMIVVDSFGGAYLAGLTASVDFPVTSNALQATCGTDGLCNGANDAFVTVLAADGTAENFSTYLGGANDDEAFALAVDAFGAAYVTGSTASPGSFTVYQGFPVTTGAFQTNCGDSNNDCNGTSDAFITKLDLGPSVSLSPISLNFGSLAVGSSSAAQTVTLTNNGLETLSVSNITINGGQTPQFTQTNNCAAPVPANGGTCTINVTFKPTSIGLQTANLTITDNATNSPQTVPLSGTGTTAGVIQLSPTTLAFGNQAVGTTSAKQPVTMTNTGVATITITSITSTAQFGQTNDCGTTLAAGASCTIDVTFTPTSSGAQTGTLTVLDNDTPNQQTVSLSGTGTQAEIEFTPTSLTFPSQLVGTTSAPMTVTITNTGTNSLAISNITLSGANAADFRQTNTCNATVTTNGNCTITVTFTPTAAGARSATIMVTDNAPGSPQSVPLSGTGTNGPSVTLTPASLTFVNQPVGTTSPPMDVTLTNSGTADLTITSITVTGTNSGDFGQTTTCVSPLGAGKSCTVSVTFVPTASGSRTATLDVYDNAQGSPQTVSLTGTGTQPAVTFSPTTLAFPDEDVGSTSAVQTTTLTNTGTADLTVSSVTVTGTNSGDFVETNTCSTVPASGTCTIMVSFKPTAAGARSANVSVADNAPGTPQKVALTGNGVAVPLVMLAPGSVAFGGQNLGSTTAASTVTLTNNGSATLTITMIAIGGANAGDFAQTNTCGTSVGAGKSCAISVTFTPSAGGSRSASLTISDNAAGAPQSVPLTGSGKDFKIAVSPGSVSVAPGVTANYTLTLTPVGGFDEMVQVSCSGTPSASKCTPAPASPTLNGSSATTVAVAVTTTAPSAAPPAYRFAPPSAPSSWPLRTPALWLAALGLLGALGLARRRRAWVMLAVAALSIVMWASCGGGSSAGGGGSKSGGTPAGTYTITITAAGGNQTHSTTVSLTVQ